MPRAENETRNGKLAQREFLAVTHAEGPYQADRVNQRFLVRIEQQGRVSYLAVKGQLNALHMAHAYALQTPSQQVVLLDATGRVLWKATQRDELLPVPPAV